jgi:predicted TIM-barrel fold metal-dependent hydrolase
MSKINRRNFLTAGAGLAVSAAIAKPVSTPIIDTHIHLFDPTRPEGVPWPPKDNPVLYKPALPDRYQTVTEGLGVIGAIEVEASPWFPDNQWVLDIAAKNPIIVGTIGNLEPGAGAFRKQLDQLHRNPLFRGIRYGNLWDRDFAGALKKPAFLSDMKALADAELVMDSANPDSALLANILKLADAVPNLRIVIDHLPQMNPPTEPAAHKEYKTTLHELANHPRVYVKISEVLRRVDSRVPTDLEFYRARLDELWEQFGENRVLFGSDWPNSDIWAPYPQVLGIVREYVSSKGPAAVQKYFWRISASVYRWAARTEKQRQLLKS